MAYTGAGSLFSRGIGRLILVFALTAIILTVMGMIDVSKDAFGSHKDFGNMTLTEFRPGDIVHGTITETIGCAATIETTEYAFHILETDKYTSSYYYVIPYYSSVDEPYPDKLVLYKTGNKEQSQMLERLMYETFYWYSGDYSSTMTHIDVDRAEVKEMNSEEMGAFRDYISEYLDIMYEGESSANISKVKDAYFDAIVPYLVQYNAGGGSTVLGIGIVMLGIFVVGVIIYLIKNKNAVSEPSYTYVGAAVPGNDPNLNSPTGLANASADPYFNRGSGTVPGGGLPQQTNTLPRQQTSFTDVRRPITPASAQPSSGAAPAGTPAQRRPVSYDPYTGKPIYKDDTFTGVSGNAQSQQPVRRPEPPRPVYDSMPSVDPKNADTVDLSNGGIEPESWEHRRNNAQMPTNGSIPVINPESVSTATMFGTVIPAAAPEPPAAPAKTPEPEPAIPQPVSDVTPIHPPTREDNMREALQVEQSDPSHRSIYHQVAGGEMSSVDPYTEKNVDVSNGGIELPEAEDGAVSDAALRRSFPSAAPMPSAPAPAPFVQPAPEPPATLGFGDMTSRFDFPTADTAPIQSAPVQPASAASASVQPIQPEPEQPAPAEDNDPGDYNIFKSGSSYNSYSSSYSGGSSYNIFKTGNDSSASGMGFPVENKEFPKVDTSFPTPGESDVGGKDDFEF